eukprot:GHVU01077014.1.p2 GENE.GHVU01077014.1~~GHVU01077014.1.p2  ORF type:complete len:110 (-),score=6.99 GHVU01077014.1:78-407(-)
MIEKNAPRQQGGTGRGPRLEAEWQPLSGSQCEPRTARQIRDGNPRSHQFARRREEDAILRIVCDKAGRERCGSFIMKLSLWLDHILFVCWASAVPRETWKSGSGCQNGS